ncbi:MAG: ABC transporter ATP-binding protein [Bacilli bacterium]|nr:ABC transporter ATP-binding protein [Bacilli bacterium]
MKKVKLICKTITFFIKHFFRCSKIFLILLVLEIVINSFNSILITYLPKLIIDNVNNTYIYINVLSYFTIYILLRISSTLLEKINFFYSKKVIVYFDDLLNKKITQIDYMNFEDKEYLDKLYYAKKCLNEYTNGAYGVIYNLKNIMQRIITLTGIIIIFLSYKQYLLFICLSFGIILTSYITNRMLKNQQKFNYESTEIAKIQSYFNNSIYDIRHQIICRTSNIKCIIDLYTDKYNKNYFNKMDKHFNKNIFLSSINILLQFLFINILPIIVLLFDYKKNMLNISTIVLLFSIAKNFGNSLSDLLFYLNLYFNDCNYLINYIYIIEEPTKRKNGVKITKIYSIKIKDLYFKYSKKSDYVLENINLELDKPQKISIVGINGAGKSTLIKLLCGLLKPSKGYIYINNIDINSIDNNSLYNAVNCMFQDYSIFSFTVKDNICIKSNDNEKLFSSLKKAEIYDKIISFDSGINTYINKWFDKCGVNFSGGELQKIAIARTFYKESNLLILDEPTASLDIESEFNVYNSINKYTENNFVFFVSHRLSSCLFSDKIIVISDKTIKEIGTHYELMNKSNSIYKRLFESQADFFINKK